MENLLRVSLVVLIGAAALTGCSRETKKARALERADRFFKEQEYAKAELEYFNALRLAGREDPKIISQLGLIYTEQGRILRAIGAFGSVVKAQPADMDAHLKLGRAFFNARMFGYARTEALLVLTNQPTNGDAIILLSDTSFGSTNVSQTRTIIEQCVAKAGPSVHTHLASANLFLGEGNLIAAEDQLKQAAAKDPNLPSLNTGWVRLRLGQTNLVEAEALLKKAAGSASPRSVTRLQWIDFHLARGDLAGAKQALNEVTQKAPDFVPAWNRLAEVAMVEKRYEDSDKITTKVLGIDSENSEAMLLRTRLAAVQGKFEEALKEAVRLDAARPNAMTKYELAMAQFRAGQTAKAVVAVDEALRADPTFAQAILLKAELSLATGNPGEAIRQLTALLKSRPELNEASMLLARAYEVEGSLDQALNIYRQMTQRYPNQPVPFNAIGVILRRKGDLAGARAAFEQSHKLAPTYAPSVEQLVDLDLLATNFPSALARCAELTATATNLAFGLLLEAKVHFVRQDTKAAETALLKGLEREPDSLAVYTLLGHLYIQTKESQKGLERLDKIIARNPKGANLSGAWMQKGIIYEQTGDRDKAIDAYRKAIELNESLVPALNNLAVLLAEDSKQLGQATEFATRARQEVPNDPSVADTLGWILYKRRNFSGALPLLRDSAEKFKMAKVVMAEVLYHLGMTEYAMGDESRARLAFDEASKGKLSAPQEQDLKARKEILDINPSSAKQPEIDQLEAAVKRDAGDFVAQMKLAAIYLSQKSTDRARNAFEAAARANPQSPQPLVALAALHADKDNPKAIQLARDARKLAPNDAGLAVDLGSVALRARDYPFALILLEDGRRTATRPDTLYLLGLAQFGNGRVAEAEATLKSFLAQTSDAQLRRSAEDTLLLINPSAGDAAKKSSLADERLKNDPNDLLALLAVAERQERENKFAEAAKTYERAIEVAPAFWPARKRAAILYDERLSDQQNAEKNAEMHATAARQASPDDPQLTEILGRIALKRKQFPEALRLFQFSAQAAPREGAPVYFIGLAHYGLKQTNDCRDALEKALKMPLKPALAEDARRRLGELPPR